MRRLSILLAGVGLMSASGAPENAQARAPTVSVAMRDQLLWLALSAMGSVMLLAVTNHITQNISSVPFLWVLPLALYLVTFILAFDHPRWYVRPLFVASLLVLVPAMAMVILNEKRFDAAFVEKWTNWEEFEADGFRARAQTRVLI